MEFQKLKAAKQAMIGWVAGILPPCAEVARLASESMERDLSFGERAKVRFHYLLCVWCQRYAQQLKFLREAMHHHPAPLESPSSPLLPDEAHARLKRALGAGPK